MILDLSAPLGPRRWLATLAVLGGFAITSTAQLADANHYHVNCVGHGFVHGADTSDRSFFSRVLAGCGSTQRTCAIYNFGNFVGQEITPDSYTMCNAWSRDFGSYLECGSSAHVSDPGVFRAHVHFARNWCG